MAMLTNPPERRYFTRHVTYRLPVIGRMAKEVVEGEAENALYAVFGGIALWISLFMMFGFAGLILPALFMTFVMFLTLIRISLG